MHASVVFGLVFTLIAGPAHAASDGLGDDPATFDWQIEAAYLKHDVSLLAFFVAADARFTQLDGDVWRKSQWLAAARSHTDLERDVDQVEVERLGDVIETGGRIHVTPQADRPEHDIYYVRLYVRREGTWHLTAHWTARDANRPTTRSDPRITQPSAFSTAYRAGNGVTVPRVIREERVQYTADAMRAGIHGHILLECVVRTDGTVDDLRVVRSLDRDYGLDAAAIRAAKQWRFEPGTLDGEPVPVIITIEMAFTLGKEH